MKTAPSKPIDWRKLAVLLPSYDGVVLKCEGVVGETRFKATLGLLRVHCKVDAESKTFRCDKY